MTIIDKDTKFTATNEEGKEIEYDILATFDSDVTNKSYVIYTDNTRNEEGNINVYASTYDPTGEATSLQPIETEKEWKIIEVLMNTLQEEIRAKKKRDELARMDVGEKNNLAYMIRRGEVNDPSKYNDKFVAELLKEGVYKKEPFSMINMSLLWALNIGGEEAWKLADGIMSNIPQEDMSFAYDWWLKVAQDGDAEGYLVHYWLLKYEKISTSPLGSKEIIRKLLSSLIKEMPIYI